MTTKKNPTTDLAVRTDDGLSLAILQVEPRALRAQLQEILGGVLDGCDKIKMPAGGALTFTVMTPAGEEARRTLEACILHVQPRRAYWPEAFGGSGTAPVCRSDDGITGTGVPGGECRLCEFARFGDDGRQPCRETLDIIFVAPHELLPTILVASPASIQPVRRYVTGLWKYYGLHPSAALTEIGLERATNRGGVLYSRLTLKMLRALPLVQQARMREVVRAFGFGPAGTDDVGDAPTTETLDVDVVVQEAPPPTDDDLPL